MYPYFDIYRSGIASTREVLEVGEMVLPTTYPRFNICTSYELIIPLTIPKTIISDPAVYPYFDIYRTGYPTLAENEQGHETEPVALGPTYPRFNICKYMAMQVQVTRLTPTFRSRRLPVLRHILYWIPYARRKRERNGVSHAPSDVPSSRHL